MTSPLLTKIRNDWQVFAATTMVRMIDARSASTLDVGMQPDEDHRAAWRLGVVSGWRERTALAGAL